MSEKLSDLKKENFLQNFNWEEFLFKYRFFIFVFLLGLILISLGLFSFKKDNFLSGGKVEVLNATTEVQETKKEMVVEIVGAVVKPGVYKVSSETRIDEVLILAGGLSKTADRTWVDKYLNRAAKVSDGQKIYIPEKGETSYQTTGSSAKNLAGDQTISSGWGSVGGSLTNINVASLSELDKLPGIGLTYGQKIIDHRPYSKIEDLVEKGVLTASTFEKIKTLISIY